MHLESGHVLLSLLIWPWSNSSSLWPWEFSITKLCSAAFASFQAILNAAASMVFLKHESEHFIPIFKNPQFSPSSTELLTIEGLCELSSLPRAPLSSSTLGYSHTGLSAAPSTQQACCNPRNFVPTVSTTYNSCSSQISMSCFFIVCTFQLKYCIISESIFDYLV